MDKFNSPEYIRSRNSYIVQSAVEYLVSLLVTGVFLTKLLLSIGISDRMIGIISSIISLAFVFQFLTLFVINIKASSKKLVMMFDTISIFCFMFLYLVPFLPFSKTAKTIIIIIGILAAYLCKYFVMNICYKWANSYVAPTKRASFSAVKEMVSLFSGMIFTVVIGYVIDIFESYDNLNGGFLFIATAILILNLCNFISFALIKKETTQEENTSVPLSIILKNTLGNKNLQNVIVLTSLWDIARYFTIGFIGIFKVKDLMMSVLLVEVVNVIGNLFRMLVSKPFGKYSDKYSFTKGFELGLFLAAIAFLANVFTTKSTWFLIIVYTIFYCCAFAGTNQNSFNIVYSYIDSKYVVQAMAIKNCIGGLLGFGASILGGKILDAVQANNNMLFGIHIYGQQILSAISLLIILIAIVFSRKVVAKQNRLIQ